MTLVEGLREMSHDVASPFGIVTQSSSVPAFCLYLIFRVFAIACNAAILFMVSVVALYLLAKADVGFAVEGAYLVPMIATLQSDISYAPTRWERSATIVV